MKCRLWWAFFLVCGSASAQGSARFQYSAPPECPTEQQFRELVRSRLLGDPHASGSAWSENDDGEVRVEVRLDPAHQRATLLLEERNAAPVERVVAGDSCEELVSGLALITALAFGSGRERSEPPEVVAPIEAAAPAPANPPPAPTTPVPSAPTAPVPASATATPSGRARDDAASPVKSSTRLSVALGAGGWMNTWSASGLMWGGDVFVRLAPRARQSWSLRAAALYGRDSAYVGDRLAEFQFVGGRAEGCPLSRDYLGRRLTGEACLALEVGALQGRGQASSALLEGASDTVFAATALITGRVRARLGERLFVEGQADLGVPLAHHEFVFEEPSERIFRTPAAGFSARLALGVQFP